MHRIQEHRSQKPEFSIQKPYSVSARDQITRNDLPLNQ